MIDEQVNNQFDAMYDNISQLTLILTELNETDKRFLSDSTRQLLIEERVDEMFGDGSDCIREMFHDGFKGINNYTDLELLYEMKETVSSWCGVEEMEDVFPYDIAGKEVELQIKIEIEKAIGLKG